MNRQLCVAAFGLGLITVGWVAAGYAGASPLALAMTLLIGAVYLAGALELRRFDQATSSLGRALAAMPGSLSSLGDWLDSVPASLQNPVRLRIEGERVALPGPSMTPFLVGLLVLLGMLGTFLGMVVTLKGAVQALESTSDLSTMRAALTAPVKGLGLAFGTSVAGVAASAALGLVSALCRRERLQVAQQLDHRIATVLRAFSLAHQREQTLGALQSQARLMPAVVDQLQAMMAQMDRQSVQWGERLLAQQDRFHVQATAAYSELAASVDRSLRQSLADGARVAGEVLQPAVEATMAGIARDTRLLHDQVADAVQRQLDGLSVRLDGTVTTLAQGWTRALAEQDRRSEALGEGWRASLDGFQHGFEQRSASLLASVADTHAGMQDTLAATLASLAQTFEQRLAALQAGLDQARRAAQAEQASRDEQRLAAWRESLAATAATLQQAWQQAGDQAQRQQLQLCQTLEQTARDLTAQSQAQARSTIGEIGRLMQAASEAPRLAAEVIAQLREQLSSSLANDATMLEERSRIMATLATLLDAVQHATTEQRGAIDALVASSGSVLERAGTRFSEQVEQAAATMGGVAAQITGGAIEVASLGEAFGFAVQRFGESSDQLVAQLQRIEGALDQSLARSDDQLAYYVAQAREIIDLSILSQKQIVDDLQQFSRGPARLAGELA